MPQQQASPAARWAPWLALALLAAFPLVAPVLGLDFYIGFVRRALIFALAAAGLNFILGFGGMAALGHAGFLGVGAYALVALVNAGVSSAWVLWPAAAAVAAGAAALIGLVALRTRGVYFIMITLAFAQMLYFVAVSLRVYGGDDGYNLPARPTLGLGLDLANEPTLYGVVLVLFAAVMALLNRATRSRFGHALTGIRDNETRMQAMGYPVFRLRLAAFVIAGAIAGLAGALLVTNNSFVSPAVMHWTQSATLIVMVVIGGVGRRWGGPVGAAAWILLEEITRQYTDYWHLPLGVLLLLIVFLAPRGLVAMLQRKPRATIAATPAGATE
ncbi:branched-chain amino acid ABC transporter permease [Variovorax sp. J22P271]|uniref:branched-chain amino acid ABC transporter permease n=1 Tax=Variovorax davisae TaxID=3053515 RepID=UPI002575C950|nr:branched-chain amino acid ABC transporter permease [Variovorax sp. J22P271]MDM0036225.1 branched-chain amino acid ABC transporter permease [Variovorax sp. J22P271]